MIDGHGFVPTTRATADSRKFTVVVWNAKPDDLIWQINASTKLLRQSQSGNATTAVFELDKLVSSAATLDVTVQKEGTSDAPVKLSVPMTE